ncbi:MULTISPECIES: hypothetical protein [unclassified Caballeronia]|uniref:hypothetical protein n=1 Tax=unclassified Caballeronia TaxID=2646786 RepID=UPI002865D0FB|nr:MULTISPECIES: hypothetical protein [unclassified Caballeronia]MDR5815897.1 hypothetical protein [Caballeronia sp. LZ033]MDR5821902.1 hypothetical protein [Caballeronia sp. LZ043]MDR5880606.1 hypothetical protein [Caballeronia sp. LZ032]
MQISGATTTSAYVSADAPAPRRMADADTTSTDADTSSDDTATQTTDPSSVKSFAYGALGLERPEVQATDANGFYTAGKWVAAAATIGGIISLFV